MHTSQAVSGQQTSTDLEELGKFLDESVVAGTEGLIVKTMDSTYEPSRRSAHWLKLKKDYLEGVGDTFDVVVLGAWHGKWVSCPFAEKCGSLQTEIVIMRAGARRVGVLLPSATFVLPKGEGSAREVELHLGESGGLSLVGREAEGGEGGGGAGTWGVAGSWGRRSYAASFPGCLALKILRSASWPSSCETERPPRRGKRKGVYGSYLLAIYCEDTEEFQTISKIGTGFSEEQLISLSALLNTFTIPSPHPYYK